jgi:hypothetical protein
LLFDEARPPVPGKRGADIVGASALACSGDFLLRLDADMKETSDASRYNQRPRSSAPWLLK